MGTRNKHHHSTALPVARQDLPHCLQLPWPEAHARAGWSTSPAKPSSWQQRLSGLLIRSVRAVPQVGGVGADYIATGHHGAAFDGPTIYLVDGAAVV